MSIFSWGWDLIGFGDMTRVCIILLQFPEKCGCKDAGSS